MKPSDIIASIGVTLLLIAFFFNLRKALSADSKVYILLNIIGAGLCCYSSYLIRFYPFVILEGIWAAVALFSFFKNVPRGTQENTRTN